MKRLLIFTMSVASAMALFLICYPANGANNVISCDGVLEGDDKYFANPEDASTYYECKARMEPVLKNCPPDLYFCSEKSTCSWIWDKQCSYTDTRLPGGSGSGQYS